MEEDDGECRGSGALSTHLPSRPLGSPSPLWVPIHLAQPPLSKMPVGSQWPWCSSVYFLFGGLCLVNSGVQSAGSGSSRFTEHMAVGRQARTHSPTVIKSESEDEQPRARWGSWSTTAGRNLSTSSLVSHSWKGGTGGRGVLPSAHLVPSVLSSLKERGCHSWKFWGS